MAEEERTKVPTKEEVEATIEKEVSIGVKEEVVDIYDELMKTIWSKIVPTLGTVTVVTICERAIFKTAQKHPALKRLKVSDTGVVFTEFKARVGEGERAALREAFRDFIANLFDILAKLTGNILVNQLLKEVEGL